MGPGQPVPAGVHARAGRAAGLLWSFGRRGFGNEVWGRGAVRGDVLGQASGERSSQGGDACAISCRACHWALREDSGFSRLWGFRHSLLS